MSHSINDQQAVSRELTEDQLSDVNGGIGLGGEIGAVVGGVAGAAAVLLTAGAATPLVATAFIAGGVAADAGVVTAVGAGLAINSVAHAGATVGQSIGESIGHSNAS